MTNILRNQPLKTTSYYSSNQALLYIGTVLVDEMVSIRYQLQNSKFPLTAYHSPYYQRTAQGQVLVSGEFTVNYIAADYIEAAMMARQALAEVSNPSASVAQKEATGPANPRTGVSPSVTAPPLNQPEIRAFLKRLSGDSGLYSKYVEEQKEVIWGKALSEAADPASKAFPRSNSMYGLATSLLSALTENNPISPPTRFDLLAPMNLVVYHGNPRNAHSPYRVIVDAEITAVHHQTGPDGSPQLETYAFIAKSLA